MGIAISTMVTAGGAKPVENACLMRLPDTLIAVVNVVKDSRLADRLMFGASATMNLSQRIGEHLVYLPAPIAFILAQLVSFYRGVSVHS